MTIGDASSAERRPAGRPRPRPVWPTLVLLTACLGWPAPARAEDPTPGSARDDVGFVRLLLDLGLPVEAGREARRLVTRGGADALPPAMGFRVGMALALVGEADAATLFLTEAAATANEPAAAEKWQLATGVVMLRAGTFPHALHLFARVEAFTTDPMLRSNAARLGCIGVVLARDAVASRPCVTRLGRPADARELEHLVAALGIDPGRRAIVGGILSGMIPGLGQLTAGHAGDAFLALVVNGASATGVTLLVLDGAVLDAALLGIGVGLRYYIGNINHGADAWRAEAERRRSEAARALVARLGGQQPVGP